MTLAIICTALLGLLVFGLGFRVSMTRMATATNYGYQPDPADPLYKITRAHGNAIEYCPMMALLILVVANQEPGAWASVLFVIATASRYLHAAGMMLSPTLEQPHALRFGGAVGTYLSGLALVVAALVVA